MKCYEREKFTFPSFTEDSGFSDFFRPINALIHFPDTPIASAGLSQSSTKPGTEIYGKVNAKVVDYTQS